MTNHQMTWLAGIVLGFIFLRMSSFRIQKRTMFESDRVQKDDWKYGSVWDNTQTDQDLANWKELVTAKRFYNHTPIFGEIGSRNKVGDQQIDLEKVQRLLSLRKIRSKIGPSQKLAEADGLFVEQKDLFPAQKILGLPQSA